MAKVIYKLGNDISTDIIYPGRYMATVLPTETPRYAFDDMADLNKMLNDGVQEGSVILGGDNFGCGSSREQAASTLKGHGVNVVARDFARIFIQNCVNLGLNTISCPDIEAEVGDDLELKEDKIINKTSGKEFDVIPHSEARQAIIEAGGLIPYTRKKLIAKMG
jgi:3-isopropylmalate/(R)-2-methylmalate dehydratase small subunit